MTEPEPDRATLSAQSVRSFDEFYREHAVELHRAVALAVGSSDLAGEAVDEAMTRAYARWRTVGAYDRPAGWVYRVALNWATSRFRKRRRETLDPFLPGSRTDTAGAAVGDPSSADPSLARALAALSVEHRSVVVLRYLLDWSEAETAAALGVATGTVKSRLNRALARLADQLGADAGTGARPTDSTTTVTTGNTIDDIDRPGGPR